MLIEHVYLHFFTRRFVSSGKVSVCVSEMLGIGSLWKSMRESCLLADQDCISLDPALSASSTACAWVTTLVRVTIDNGVTKEGRIPQAIVSES